MKQGWEYKKLGEVAMITMGQSPSSDTYNETEGIPFFQGNADFGIEHPNVRIYCSAPIRIAKSNDILISVRAPIGAINVADQECCIGRGLAAIRNGEKTDSRFILYSLRANKQKLVEQGTGSTFKSIGKDILKGLSIPVPPLTTQQSIVSELDTLSQIIADYKEQLADYDKLEQSIFYDMFGDPVKNEKGWEVKKLGEIGSIGRGVSKHRPRNAPELLGGTMPLIQTGDVANADFYIKNYNSTYSELGVAQSKVWKKGTLCITIAATIGKCAFLNFDACFPDSVVGFISKEEFVDNIFVYFIFRNMQKILEEAAPCVAQKNINLSILEGLNIPIPPLPLQQQFASKIESIEQMKADTKAALQDAELLFQSRMDYWFNA